MTSFSLFDLAFLARSSDPFPSLPASNLLYANTTLYPFNFLNIVPSVTVNPGVSLTYSLDSGSLPASATLNPSTGIISGLITASPGIYQSLIRASWSIPGSDGSILSNTLVITVLSF